MIKLCKKCKTPEVYALDLCRKHYMDQHTNTVTCDEFGCHRSMHGRGKCTKHYQKLRYQEQKKNKYPGRDHQEVHKIESLKRAIHKMDMCQLTKLLQLARSL